MSKPTVQDLIVDINQANRGFWVCAIAKESWPVLIEHLDQLDEMPRLAVEHYAKIGGTS